ncbi:MAG: MFS transporter [Paucibacter sp.]|nr:MFS transporter [Roseateles sp.]
MISGWMTFQLAFACGLIVANLYYAQPLAGPIGQSLGLAPAATGLIVTLTQIGYGLGLLLIVPLGDLIETRRLVCTLLVLAALASLALALSSVPAQFFAATLALGMVSVAAQVLVPFAAHLAPPEHRGRVVGNVMSGLMTGIMLARPVASFIAQLSAWHVVFFTATAAMALLALMLRLNLPQRRPEATLRYGALLASMTGLMRRTPVLRRRALYHAALFGAFSVFWTTTPLLLARTYGLSQGGIALFALAGVAGAIASPIAGRLADRGHSRAATVLAMLLVAGAYLMTHLAAPGSKLGLGLLVAAGIVLDSGVTTNLVVGQRAIFALGAEVRSRLNGLYMATFFAGGAIGSAAGGWAFAHGGWAWASALGIALPLVALAYLMTEPKTRSA